MFDRIDSGRAHLRRSESPRRSDVRGATPEGIDRYVPSRNGNRPPRRSRSRSPPGRRDGTRGIGRPRPGTRREDGGRGLGTRPRNNEGRPVVGGRPRKTAEELDAEMEDYWGSGNVPAQHNGVANDGTALGIGSTSVATTSVTTVAAANDVIDDDIDMIQ